MARPSRNIDQALLDAGLALLPRTGCAGLSARRLAEHAGVNLGMLHYHFGSKDNFIRELLARMYEEMFAALVLRAGADASPRENLREALKLLARFALRHRHVLARIFADALAGERVALEFLAANVPRHVTVLARLVRAAQRKGELVRAPVPQVLAFVAGGVVSPVLLGTAIGRTGALPAAFAANFETQVLSVRALDRRIGFALRGLAPEREP